MLSLRPVFSLALAMAFAASAKFVDIDLFQSDPFWGTYMDFGDAKNVSMLIDSGEPYTSIFDPSVYKPSPNATSLNTTNPAGYVLNHTHWLGYGQVKKNACGGLYFWCDVYTDVVNWQGLALNYQRFCVADHTDLHFKNQVSQIPPFQGLLGFTTNNEVQVGVGGRTLISSLYAQGQIDELRFGTAFGTAGTGTMVLGGVDHSLFEGDLVYQRVNGGEWMFGNMSVTANGSAVLEKQEVWLDTGGPAITASFEQVRTVFEGAGIEAFGKICLEDQPFFEAIRSSGSLFPFEIEGHLDLVLPSTSPLHLSFYKLLPIKKQANRRSQETETSCGRELFGYYPCDNPPQIGLSIGGTNFDILPSALRMKDDGANNCTAIIVGQPNENLYSFWIVGQAFMQGKYIDHDGGNATRFETKGARLGFATLKNPADPKSARLTDAGR